MNLQNGVEHVFVWNQTATQQQMENLQMEARKQDFCLEKKQLVGVVQVELSIAEWQTPSEEDDERHSVVSCVRFCLFLLLCCVVRWDGMLL